jgi:hypothetical protein
MQPTLIYFIEGIGTGQTKIGKSIHPGRRVAQLQTGNPTALRLLATVQAEERDLHRFFAPFRLHGEWFEKNVALDAMIEHCRQHGSLPPHEQWMALFDRDNVIQDALRN